MSTCVYFVNKASGESIHAFKKSKEYLQNNRFDSRKLTEFTTRDIIISSKEFYCFVKLNMSASDELYEIDPESEREEADHIEHTTLRYILIIVGILFGMVVIFWLMLRLNRRLNTIRDAFWPTVKRIALVGIGFVVVVSIVIYLLNLVGKKWAYDKNYTHTKPDDKITKK